MSLKRWVCGVLAALMLGGGGTAALAEEASASSAYIAVASKAIPVYAKKNTDSKQLYRVEADATLDVTDYDRTWLTLEGVDGQPFGYVQRKYTERLQPRDPTQGLMPGVTAQAALAVATQQVSFRPAGYSGAMRYPEGTVFAVQEVRDSAVGLVYGRMDGLQSMDRAGLDIQPVVPWRDAQPGDLISAYTTYYATSPYKHLNQGRMANLALTCHRLDGVTVAAGADFSFNQYCAPYTKENGYVRAPIVSGSQADGYGGGACQVSTTLHNAAIRIPSVLKDHHLHSQNGAPYTPPGRDATVGDLWDYVFQNALPYDIRMAAYVGDGVLTIAIYRAENH